VPREFSKKGGWQVLTVVVVEVAVLVVPGGIEIGCGATATPASTAMGVAPPVVALPPPVPLLETPPLP
jgi:hypothetical protein